MTRQPDGFGMGKRRAFAVETGHITLSGNYMLLKENVLDLTDF